MEEQSSRHIPQSIKTMMELSNSAAVVRLKSLAKHSWNYALRQRRESHLIDHVPQRLESLLFQPIRQPETLLPRSC
jgi:hypothetical protein